LPSTRSISSRSVLGRVTDVLTRIPPSYSPSDFLGFDRTREISGHTAQEIAEAAKAWGQNDDISVVTVRRLAP